MESVKEVHHDLEKSAELIVMCTPAGTSLAIRPWLEPMDDLFHQELVEGHRVDAIRADRHHADPESLEVGHQRFPPLQLSGAVRSPVTAKKLKEERSAAQG